VTSSAPEPLPRPAVGAWLRVLRRYFPFVAVANLAWEVTHLPLYTLWQEGSVGENAFAVVHCTGGDLLIATASLVLALLLFAARDWPEGSFLRVAAAAVVFGVGYTVFSEWLNTGIRGSWAYTDRMPIVPILGTGLSPLAQWLVVPLAAFWWARRPAAFYSLRTYP
jgi:hypothetical protein